MLNQKDFLDCIEPLLIKKGDRLELAKSEFEFIFDPWIVSEEDIADAKAICKKNNISIVKRKVPKKAELLNTIDSEGGNEAFDENEEEIGENESAKKEIDEAAKKFIQKSKVTVSYIDRIKILRNVGYSNEELAVRFQEDGDTDVLYALVFKNKNWIYKKAKEILKRADERGNRVEMDDLFSEGFLALVTAAVNYDYTYETTFLTYATKLISEEMTNYLMEMESVVKLGRERTALAACVHSLRDDNPNLSGEELLKLVNKNRTTPITMKQMERAKLDYETIWEPESLSREIGDTEMVFGDTLADSDVTMDEEISKKMDEQTVDEILDDYLSKLSEMEREFVLYAMGRLHTTSAELCAKYTTDGREVTYNGIMAVARKHMLTMATKIGIDLKKYYRR